MMQIKSCLNVSAVKFSFTNIPVTKNHVINKVKSQGAYGQAVRSLPKLTDLNQQTLTKDMDLTVKYEVLSILFLSVYPVQSPNSAERSGNPKVVLRTWIYIQ